MSRAEYTTFPCSVNGAVSVKGRNWVEVRPRVWPDLVKFNLWSVYTCIGL